MIPVGLAHLLDAAVDHVVLQRAAAVLPLEALEAGDAAVHQVPADLHELRLDALLLQRAEDVVDQANRIPVLTRASVECDDFHGFSFRHEPEDIDPSDQEHAEACCRPVYSCCTIYRPYWGAFPCPESVEFALSPKGEARNPKVVYLETPGLFNWVLPTSSPF
jgi:hypothetical protein